MQRLLRPTILTLSLTVPPASMALGLGDIRVDSALHQPLVAQIELLGAADDELGRLSAAIASDDLFQRYNLERAPFIYGTTLSVGRDAQGRPVLNMRSTEKFTEPVVTLLVDLHTPHGELVREYTLFLDPAGLVDNGGVLSNTAASSDAAVTTATARTTSTANFGRVESTSAASASAGSTGPAASSAPVGVSSKALGQTYTVSRRDTLDRIVTAAGARSRIERHRMMIAIFRNNPAAFQNNFNRMHAGATLTFPTAEQLAAISVEETNREYDAQMAAWHSSRSISPGTQSASASTGDVTTGSSVVSSSGSTVSGRPAKVVDGDRRDGSSAAGTRSASVAVGAGTGSGTAAAASAEPETMPTEPAALKRRIASLEQSLAQVQQQLKEPLPAQAGTPPITSVAHHVAPGADMTSGSAAAPTSAASTAVTGAVREALQAASPNEDESPAPKNHLVQLIAAAIGAAALFLAGAWFFLRRRNSYIYTGPKHGTASAETISSHDEDTESHDSVDFTAATASFAQLPVAGSVRGNKNAPAAAETTSGEPNAMQTDSERRAQKSVGKDTNSDSSWFEDSFSTPIADLLNDPTVSLAIDETAALPADLAEPTVKLPAKAADETTDTEVLVAPDLQFAGDTVEQQFGFFNPEATTNTEHVVMGSALNEPKPFTERRKNPAEVLRQAIEREPDRSDLRLKLLELYYTAAAENRRAFLEATRQLTQNENLATPEDWSRIADMGRIIAPDDELFSSDGDADDKRVA